MLIDNYGRTVDYLRISVMENCNFRCMYCMPNTPLEWMPKENLLSVDALFSLIRIGIDHGIKKIRITGGEPTLRQDLGELLSKIRDYDDNVELTLTTNGYLLEQKAREYLDAGLRRVNISLDTLDRELFKIMTKRDGLPHVLNGIYESLNLGLKVKINMVPLKGFNDHEITSMLKFCKSLGIPLRYIEFMENHHAFPNAQGLKSDEILETISKDHLYMACEESFFGPATMYRLMEGYRFGIIEPHREDFCKHCNRIRLTSDGKIVPCLYFDEAIDASKALKNQDEQHITSLLFKAVENKPEKNRWNYDMSQEESSGRAFYQTGG